ncbi:phage tail tape measure protein [Arthrobacter agilis]|uniref:phage tail tape measure protein n=1 Tax=Arthrobacter agilis TaxID=37921 RepID=UPI0023671CF5|nr:phage tail tape measure protein [Arthrobacter agilis]WDF34542.1 phage tail tape measure protein [Arthrobacter agilis]
MSSTRAAEAGLSTYSSTIVDAARASEAAAAAAERARTPLQRLGSDLAASARDNAAEWQQVGASVAAFGAVAVGALGFAAKAAMDWESAWAGVTKTVDGTPEQMAEMEQGLRNLAKTLPLAHAEIAAVAEAAGQLGVAREDVIGFTKTMIDLGESTNLTADEAATQIAQISNVTGLMAREGAEGVSRFGATLVELGNNGASTEADILAMAQRIAGAMTTVGGSEVEILAVSNALASMGVKAELGGGVTTRVLLKMYSSIKEGGKSLESFAQTAGVSAEAFSAAFESSPVTALSMVAQGLNRVKDEGGNVVASLADMGLKGTETTQVMLALANSGTLLADGLDQGSVAYRENTALLEEAAKRYATTESQVKISWNNIKDAAIDAGAALLPVITGIADMVTGLSQAWGNLPTPVQEAVVGLTGVVGVAALLAGGLMTLIPKIVATRAAMATIAPAGGRAAGAIAGLGKALGVAAVAVVGFMAIKGINNAMQPAKLGVEDLTQALIGLKDSSTAIDDVFANLDPGTGGALLKNVHDVGDALAAIDPKGLTGNLQSFGATALGVDNDMAKMLATVDALDQSLTSAAQSGNMELAAQGFKKIADSAKENDVALEDVVARFPQYEAQLQALANQYGYNYKEGELYNAMLGKLPAGLTAAMEATDGTSGAVEQAAAEMEAAAAASEELIEALAELGISADGTIQDLQKFTDMLFDMGLATMSSRDAAFGWEESLRGMGEAVQGVVDSQGELGAILNATGTDFNTMSEAGKNANGVLQGIVSDGLKVAETFSGDLSKSAADVNQQLISTYDAGVQTAMGLGLGEEAAIALTRELMGIPPGVSVETWMSEAAEMRADTTGEAIGEIPDSVYVETAMSTAAFETAGMTKKAADDIPNQETIDSWMSDAAFQEALRTRAAALGIPEREAIDSFMSSAARNEADSTTAQILRIPAGASVSSFMDAYARDMANQTAAAVAGIPSYKQIDIVTKYSVVGSPSTIDTDAGGFVGRGQVGISRAHGGRIPKLAIGGRLPTTGPGTEVTDGIYGISSKTGLPAAMLDGGEWIVNAKSSDKHHNLIAAVNRDDPRLSMLPAFAGGGRSSRQYAPAGASYGGAGAGMGEIALSSEDRALMREAIAVSRRPARFYLNNRQFAEAQNSGRGTT